MKTLIRVDQLYCGHYVNTVYGDELLHVDTDDFSYYRLMNNGDLVATFSDGTAPGTQYSMLKDKPEWVCNGLRTKSYVWNLVPVKV